MFKKISAIAYLIYLKFIQLFIKKDSNNRLIIIKVDAIGDYIIFRNFLQVIAKSSQYQGFKITLVCNIVIKQLVNELDKQLIEDFIYIDHNPEKKDWKKLVKDINKNAYDTLINFHYSRTPTTELISFASSAKKKITIKGDNLRIGDAWKSLFDRIYEVILHNPKSIKSEFEFNKYFTEKLINVRLPLNAPVIQLDEHKHQEYIPHTDFIAIAPAAGVTNRQLEITTLNKLIEFLLNRNYTVCFIGSNADLPLINSIINQVPSQHSERIINLSGKLSLGVLPYVLNKSLGIICNDSGIYHMSVALNKPVLCFAGGGHFDRFVNYVNRDNVKICYEAMPCYNCNWRCIFKFDLAKPYPCIDAIETDAIYHNVILLEKQWLVNNEQEKAS